MPNQPPHAAKMLGFAQWRSARSLAYGLPARDRRRNAGDLGQANFLQIEQSSPDCQIYFGHNREGYSDPDGRKPNELPPIHKSPRMPFGTDDAACPLRIQTVQPKFPGARSSWRKAGF